MPESVFVSGQFLSKALGKPVDGIVYLIPSRMWIEEDGIFYAIMAPTIHTEDGNFKAEVTACHPRPGDKGWHYRILCPSGVWTMRPDGPQGTELSLADLIPKKAA